MVRAVITEEIRREAKKESDNTMSKKLYVKIKEQDNVAIAVQEIKADTVIEDGLTANQDIPQAHKIALCDIPEKGEVIRYGVVLGYAKQPICKGDWINEHMLYLPESPSL